MAKQTVISAGRMGRRVGMKVRQATARRHEPMAPWPQTAQCRPTQNAIENAPIWFAALSATRCQAMAEGEMRNVRFDYVSGRALYTNQSAAAEEIQPLGAVLQGGETVAVYWTPGETGYTVEVYRQDARACA